MPAKLRLLRLGGSHQDHVSAILGPLHYILNSNDPFSSSHVLNAQRLALRTARAAGLAPDEVSTLSLAAYLNGYPLRLRGEEMLTLARIKAVAHAFAPMTAPRPYRAAMPVQASLKVVRRGSGTQFDPQFGRLLEKLMAPVEQSTKERDQAGAEAREGTK